MTDQMAFSVERQEYVTMLADQASPREPNANLNVDHERGIMWLEVVLPGTGSTWDQNEIDLQNELLEYFPDGYDVTVTEPIQDMDGRTWSQFKISVGPLSDPPIEQEVSCMSTYERGCRCDQCVANHEEEEGR